MFSPDIFPHLEIVLALAKARQAKVYLVGGFLRDQKLGKNGTDFDFTVNKKALDFARAFARRVKGAFVLLDKERGCARVVKRQGDAIRTFDFADFRGGKDLRSDLRLRDFTVNTLCVDMDGDKDCSLPSAARDLKSKVVRMVGARIFDDDPLRLLRAFSLSAQTGFTIESRTLSRITKNAHLINRPAMERVREEFFKILASPRAFEALKRMDAVGLLERVIPQVAVMRGVKQGGYHHLDVWQHSLEVLHQLEKLAKDCEDVPLRNYLDEEIGGAHKRLALLKLAALLHDIGKPDTRQAQGARMTFHGHEHVGERITRLVAKRLKLSVKERHFLEDVVRMHLRPGYLSNPKRPTQKALFRYLRDTKEEAASIAFLAMADQRATRGPLTTEVKAKHHDAICRMIIDEYFKEKVKPERPRLITGNDLIKALKLKPGPIFAEILTAVEEAQSLGTITTKAQALVLARDTINRVST